MLEGLLCASSLTLIDPVSGVLRNSWFPFLKMTTSFSASSEPFFSHLNVHKTPHVFLTAETDDFDENIIDAWQDEGFKTYYVPLGDGGPAYTKKIHSLADNIGVGENYAIVGNSPSPSAISSTSV